MTHTFMSQPTEKGKKIQYKPYFIGYIQDTRMTIILYCSLEEGDTDDRDLQRQPI